MEGLKIGRVANNKGHRIKEQREQKSDPVMRPILTVTGRDRNQAWSQKAKWLKNSEIDGGKVPFQEANTWPPATQHLMLGQV